MRTLDPKVQITALVCVTILVLSFVFALTFNKKTDPASILQWFGIVLAIVLPQIMALFKSDETSRKIDEVRDIAKTTQDQTNGGLSDNVEEAVRQALTKILTGNIEEAQKKG